MTEKDSKQNEFSYQETDETSSVGIPVPTDERICNIHIGQQASQSCCIEEGKESPKELDTAENEEPQILDNTDDLDDLKVDYDYSSVNQYTETVTAQLRVIGVSLIGRSHIASNDKCQDYHRYFDLGHDWHIFLLSDGAGSAKESHRGSKIVCEAGLKLIERLFEKLEWHKSNYIPSETEWNIEFTAVCRKLKQYMEDQIDMLDENVRTKDFNATFELMIVSPNCILMGHIGDGRMGYQSMDGEWHNIMIPHKGEEKNQTLFVLNHWDKTRVPAYRINGIYVPETRVVIDHPQAVMLLSDGCENFSWNCTQYTETGEIHDVNTPYVKFWDSLKLEMSQSNNYKLSFVKFIDSFNEACLQESDDRSMIFAEFFDSSIPDEDI